MDDQLRRVERQALSGDPEAKILLQQLYGRLGLYFRDQEREEHQDCCLLSATAFDSQGNGTH